MKFLPAKTNLSSLIRSISCHIQVIKFSPSIFPKPLLKKFLTLEQTKVKLESNFVSSNVIFFPPTKN